MAKAKNGSHAPSQSVTLQYQLIRNTTSPDEQKTGVKSFFANLPAFEILKLGTRDNLRAYIPEYNPKKRNRVHDAIADTIDREPERFITRNSGFVITASGIEIDDNKKTAKLKQPSVINGAQSQGEVRRFIEARYEDDDLDGYEPPFHVRAEIIVDDNETEVTETAIARNTATPVKSISQAGARGQLDELEESIRAKHPDIFIRKKETDDPETHLDTRRIIQYARLLMPMSVSGNASAAEKLRAYKNPEQCLTDFCRWHEDADRDEEARAKYDFTVSIAPQAIKEYVYWETHDGWNGHYVWGETKKGGRACKREGNRVVWVSPGLIFPVMGAMSEFVEQSKNGEWRIKKPGRFKPDEMIKRCIAQFRAHNSDPMAMGRSEAAYDALRIYPQTLVEVMREIEEEKTR